ncbi:bile acid:sodium symporter [uncultured Abyssibacter sp.]|uniref:bile acid:sodium symporter family protein n=1 Tax=uncultured Abyssibacter sp. TaxID=2320202 RepID=UPI0032B10F00
MSDFYLAHEYWFAAAQLVLAMLGMGATLTLADFRRVFADPQGFGVGMVLQLLVAPALAWVFIDLFGVGPGLAVGLAVCAAVPGGTVSNVFTYFAQGHIALSIALTAVATVACLITTPLILDLLVSHHMPAGFDMPSGRIAVEIGATLLLPLILGMLYLRALPASAATFSKWCIRGSLFVIGLIVIGALTAGRLDLESFGLVNVGYVFGFVLALAAVSYGVPRLMGLSSSDVTAINVEVTVRNTNLGLLIKASLFPAVVGTSDPVGDNTLFAILLYGALMLLLSAALIPWHRRRNA